MNLYLSFLLPSGLSEIDFLPASQYTSNCALYYLDPMVYVFNRYHLGNRANSAEAAGGINVHKKYRCLIPGLHGA